MQGRRPPSDLDARYNCYCILPQIRPSFGPNSGRISPPSDQAHGANPASLVAVAVPLPYSHRGRRVLKRPATFPRLRRHGGLSLIACIFLSRQRHLGALLLVGVCDLSDSRAESTIMREVLASVGTLHSSTAIDLDSTRKL